MSSSGDSILANAIIKSQGYTHTELERSLSLCLVSQKRDKEKIPEEEGDSGDGSHAAANQGMPGP